MSDDLTTPLEEDVNVADEQNLVDQEVVEEVEQETSANTSEYDKAWEDIDTDNPSDDLFGETTVDDNEVSTQPDQVEDVTEDDSQVETTGLMIKNPVLKYKDQMIPIDSEEEAIKLMQKGFKLESEMTKMKPMKGFINILKEGNISIEDLQTFKDALSGNDGAKQSLASKLGLQSQNDTSSFFDDEVNEEKKSDYKPEVKAEDPVSDYFAGLTEENPEVAGRVSKVYSDIDDEFKVEVYTPQVFPMFASSIASGEFDKLYPLAIKARVNNPGLTWLQAYKMAGQGSKVREKVVPPKSTEVTKPGASRHRVSGDDYDRAFSMDTKDLEAKLFG